MTESDDDIPEDEDAAEDVPDDDSGDSDKAVSDDVTDDVDFDDVDSGDDDSGDDDSGDDDGPGEEGLEEDSDETDEANLDPFADQEEEDLSFLMGEADEEGYIDLSDDEDEEAEDTSGGGFRVSFLLVAYLVVLLFFGGVIGWLLMAGEEEVADTETTSTFTSLLPPETEEPDRAPIWGDGPAGMTGPGEASETAMVNGDGMTDGEEGGIQSPARLLPRAFLEKEMAQLTPSPDPELVEEMADGPLPKIAEDGRMSFRVYARPFDHNDQRPRIAIIIQNMGLSHNATETAIQQLPGSVTLAFSPYADNLEHWTTEARRTGHEILLAMPMEPVNYPLNDPGPYALITGLSPEQNAKRLQWLMSRFTGYVGVTNEMGSRFITSNQDIRPVLEIFHNRGLMFVDNRVTSRSVAIRVAQDVGLPWAAGDRSIDRNPSRQYIDDKLAEIQRIALDKGSAVAMALPYPVTFERLALWLPKLEEEGFVVAPVSAVIHQQGPEGEEEESEEAEASDEGEQ